MKIIEIQFQLVKVRAKDGTISHPAPHHDWGRKENLEIIVDTKAEMHQTLLPRSNLCYC